MSVLRGGAPGRNDASGSLVRLFAGIYSGLLRLYPSAFRRDFGEEMQDVCQQTLEQAVRGGLGRVVRVGLRELFQSPPVLLRAHWAAWRKAGRAGGLAGSGMQAAGGPALEPLPPDGRDSLAQAALEIGPFVALGGLLLAAVYLPFVSPGSGWQRDLGLLGVFCFGLPLLAFLVGLARGLPRWSYPLAGLMLGFSFIAALSYRLVWMWALFLAAGLVLGLAAGQAHSRWPLPLYLRRMWAGLRQDWSRLSFGVYGLTPLLTLLAFDDGWPDNQTPYLALAVAVMLAAGWVYTRSRRLTVQLGALLAGLSGSYWMALPDQAHFGGPPGLAWMLPLWLAALVLILLPGLAALAFARRARMPRGG